MVIEQGSKITPRCAKDLKAGAQSRVGCKKPFEAGHFGRL
jgi:hypothetical protein